VSHSEEDEDVNIMEYTMDDTSYLNGHIHLLIYIEDSSKFSVEDVA
jgi:hypothetical protein